MTRVYCSCLATLGSVCLSAAGRINLIGLVVEVDDIAIGDGFNRGFGLVGW